MILNSSSEIEFCRLLLAAGIVSTNLYLKNLRFVNWKPEIEFYQLRHSARRTGVRSSFNEQELLCHIN